MFRTAATVTVAAFVGLVVLRVVLGVMGGMVGLFFGAVFLVAKLAILALIIYFVLSMISPDTAKRVRAAVGLDDSPPV